MQQNKNIQLIWGIALTLVGIGVFIRIPQVMPQLAKMEQFADAMWFVRFCFYFMAVILTGGGIKKIIGHFRPPHTAPESDKKDHAHNRTDR